MRFCELLKKTLKDIGVSVTKLSSDTDCTRVFLYSVFNGEKKLSEEIFRFIISKYDFSPLQISELERLFYIENLTATQKELLSVLKDELENIGKEHPSSLFLSKEFTVSNDGVLLSGSSDYYSAIAAFIKNESGIENNAIYTNYSFFDVQADNMIFDFAKSAKNGLVIKHTVRMGNETDIKERIRNICSAVKFSKLGHITNVSGGGTKDLTFASYFIGTKTILQYDPQSECGFLSGDGVIVNGFRLLALKKEKEKPLLNGFSKSALELKDILSPLQKNMLSFLDFRFPANLFTTKKILGETLKKELPFHDEILKTFWDHVKHFQAVKTPGLFSQLGMQRFALDGVASDASSAFLSPISPENRIELFRRYKESIEKTDYSLKIINSNILKITEHCAFEIYNDGFSLLFRSDINPEEAFIGGCYIICKDEQIAKLLLDFKDYICLSDAVLSKEYAKLFTEDLINQCRAMIKSAE